jgi:hypothetical protein
MIYRFNIDKKRDNTNIKMNTNVSDETCMTIDFNRKIIELIIEKKQQINYHWIGASKLYNYINDDPLLDWLQMYGKIKGYKTDDEINYEIYCNNTKEDILSFDEYTNRNNEYSFMKYIINQGIEYENYVINQIKNKYGENVIDLNDYNFGKYEYDKKLEKTRDLIKNNTPIIYQGLVCDPDTKTFGFPDLIIREDYLPYFTSTPSEELLEEKQHYNYYIFDIKFHTLQYKKDCNHLIANVSQQQYISQMFLYTKGLRHLIHPSVLNSSLLDHKAYIIGRSWNIDTINTSVGLIHFRINEKVLDKIKKGIEWYSTLKKYGDNWFPSNPHMYELYPNMKNDKDNNWRKTKQLLAEQLGEISMIWYCGNTIKRKAHSDGIRSWHSPQFNLFDYTEKTDRTLLINRIIKINKQSTRTFECDCYQQIKLKWKPDDIFTMVSKNTIVMDGFIDIENTIDIKSIDIPKQDSIVYMIGLYYNIQSFTTRNKTYKTNMSNKTFCVKSLDDNNEKQILEDFLLYLKSFHCDKHITWRLYHYSGVEKYTLNKLMERYNLLPETYGISIVWIDLYEVLIQYKFVFKNCYDYSLKSINKALSALEYIPDDCIYDNCVVKNGLDSIIAVYKCDQEARSNNKEFNKSIIMDDIIYYNMIDCESLFHIRDFMASVIKA